MDPGLAAIVDRATAARPSDGFARASGMIASSRDGVEDGSVPR